MQKILILFAIFFSLVSISAQPFITTWKTDESGTSNSTSITIPTFPGETYSYDVDWDNDGTFDDFGIMGDITHDYLTAGTYTVRIQGTFPRIYFNNSGDGRKLKIINQWGSNIWTSMESAFHGADYMISSAVDVPNLTMVTDMSSMFEGTVLFNGALNGWDVSNVTNMSKILKNATGFNKPLNNWNVSNVTNMSQMFKGATAFNNNVSSWNVISVTNMSEMFSLSIFNGDINGWNVSNVTNMEKMFNGAIFFTGQVNGGISGWNVSNVTNMSSMFASNGNFNSNISGWNVSAVTDMSNIFYNTGNFNRNLNNWNVSSVLNMMGMFYRATSFNSNLTGWDVSNVTNISEMFREASAFNGSVNGWDVSNITDMSYLFYQANSFTGIGLDTWDVHSVTNMLNMFAYATSFTGLINGGIQFWNVSNVTNMSGMFSTSIHFNGEISTWNVGSVTGMAAMFENADAFNKNINNWNVSNVTTMRFMFESANNFNQPLNLWNVSNVTNMQKMFKNADSFDQSLGDWDIGMVTDMSEMLNYCGMDIGQYDSTLIGWDIGGATNKSVGALFVEYCAGNTARNNLINNKGWAFSGDAFNCPVPPNDLCSGAIVLAVGTNGTCNNIGGTNANATDSGIGDPGCADYQGADIWYQVTVPASGELTMETNDAMRFSDTGMAAYSGSDCNNLSLIICNDDDGGNVFSKIELTGRTPNEVIYIRVWEYGNEYIGDFNICVYEPLLAPINDDICDAIDLTSIINDGQSHTYTNFGATVEPGEPMPTASGCNNQNGWCTNTISSTVWFSFTAPISGNINIDITNNIDLQLAVWEANDCMGMTGPPGPLMVAANDDSGTGGGLAPQIIDLRCLIPGKVYFVQVDEYKIGDAGSFDIKIDDLGNACSVAPLGLNCSNSFNASSAGNGEWIHLMSGGNVVASVNDMNNNLGAITAQTNIFNGTTRQDANGDLYLDRSFAISANQAQAIIRLYITPAELADLGVLLKHVNLWHIAGGNCTGSYSNGGQLIQQSAYKSEFDGTNHMIEFLTPGFSEFFLHGQSSLPINLIHFKGQGRKDHILLEWGTASEQNNKGFDIQHSTDGKLWKQIGFVEGQGNSTKESHYQLLDKNPISGLNFYRLLQLDIDGTSSYSKIISVKWEDRQAEKITLYPNPTSGELTLITTKTNTSSSVQIFNIFGKEMSIPITKEPNEVKLDLTALPSGIYFISIETGGLKWVEKVVRE